MGPEVKDEYSLNFQFQLDPNCPISHKSSSLYILCGNQKNLLEAGALELSIGPNKWIQKFIETFVLFFRFKVKSVKSKKEFVEYKLVAPDTKEFGAITSLLVLLKREDTDLHVNYQFKVKKLDYLGDDVVAKDEKIQIDQILKKGDYQLFEDAANQDKIKEFLSEALDQVKTKTLI